MKLKGVPEPVTLYRIVRASGAGRRTGQRHLTPRAVGDITTDQQASCPKDLVVMVGLFAFEIGQFEVAPVGVIAEILARSEDHVAPRSSAAMSIARPPSRQPSASSMPVGMATESEPGL
jgi:hypothetical protein